MSGNAHQRKLARDHQALLELGRQQRAALDGHAAEIAALKERHAAELANVRARYEAELAEVQQRYSTEVESWARASRADADLVASLRAQLQAASDRRQELEAELGDIKRGGLLTRREHETAVEAETARLRDRLRRAREERLAPKTIVLEQLAADPKDEERKLRAALTLQRANFRALLSADQTIDTETLRLFGHQCITEINAVLGTETPS